MSTEQNSVYYERSEEEVNMELHVMADRCLNANNWLTIGQDNLLAGIPPAYEYRTFLRHDKTKYTIVDKLAGGQLAGGYKVNGSLYYDPNGGSSYSIGVSIGAPWASVSFSGTTGQKSVSGMNVNLPDGVNY